jgi:alkylresorcinol/alkylpyrone synthase
MVSLLSVATAHPEHRVQPAELKSYICRSLTPASAARFCRVLDNSEVRSRHTVAPIADLLELRSVDDRVRRFAQHSLALGETVARQALTASGVAPEEIGTVVSVSSTGYMAPSLDAHLVERLGLCPTVRRLPIGQLGCSGAVSAIATAADLVKHASGRALVVSVEICSLCVQRSDPSRTDLIASILFGDGAAAAVLAGGPRHAAPEIVASRSVLLPGSVDRVGIQPSANGLRLVLARDVAAIIRRTLPELAGKFLELHGLHPRDLSFWLVHPGGPRILEAVEQSFALPRAELEHSWAVWRECGNMSSATALFVLERWLRSAAARARKGVALLLAFGPGVSCEMVLIRRGGAARRNARSVGRRSAAPVMSGNSLSDPAEVVLTSPGRSPAS